MGFWAVAAPIIAQVGSSIISNMMNKKSASEQGLERSLTAKNQAEAAILAQRQRMIDRLWGRTPNFRRDIVGPGGEKFVFRLPGVGGGNIDTAKQLSQLINAIDFGDKREFDAMLQVLGLTTSGNSAGAAESMRQSLASDRRQSSAGFGSIFGDAIEAGINYATRPKGGGSGGDTGAASNAILDAVISNPYVDAGELLDVDITPY